MVYDYYLYIFILKRKDLILMSVWAFADLHGRKDLFDFIMEKIGPKDKVYC